MPREGYCEQNSNFEPWIRSARACLELHRGTYIKYHIFTQLALQVSTNSGFIEERIRQEAGFFDTGWRDPVLEGSRRVPGPHCSIQILDQCQGDWGWNLEARFKQNEVEAWAFEKVVTNGTPRKFNPVRERFLTKFKRV
jgi:hypothetical protein